MQYHALACDYDGTIAWDGKVDPETIAALEQVRRSGRKLLLVTGRELDDLVKNFPQIDLFDRLVIENGAVVYRPDTREKKLLGEAPPKEFAERLIARGAERVSVGDVIVATWEPYETIALEVIREMGLELQIIFNKGAVMILPSGINKAVGLSQALKELCLSPHNVVGVGDAENDHAFLSICECSVAVSNALDTVKQRVDWVTQRSHGDGVQDLIRQLLESDLASVAHRRRYAEGELPPDLSFYFRGPEGKLNLRAQNLSMFLRIADGVDDETWLHHLHNGHFSRWFVDSIKDPELAAETDRVARDTAITAESSRKKIREQIEQRYILAA
jgi:HAD superfamily hydrolase (TIGR01484 family)